MNHKWHSHVIGVVPGPAGPAMYKVYELFGWTSYKGIHYWFLAGGTKIPSYLGISARYPLEGRRLECGHGVFATACSQRGSAIVYTNIILEKLGAKERLLRTSTQPRIIFGINLFWLP